MVYKQVIVIRSDLKMAKGKIASQAAHASVEAVLRSRKENIERWREEGMPKIVLKVIGENELLKAYKDAKREGLNVVLISDAGKTSVTPGTKTSIGVGPDEEKKIDKIFREYKLL